MLQAQNRQRNLIILRKNIQQRYSKTRNNEKFKSKFLDSQFSRTCINGHTFFYTFTVNNIIVNFSFWLFYNRIFN